MEREHERPDPSITVGDLILTPVVRVSIRARIVAGQLLVQASKHPVAIEVQSPTHSWRIDVPEGPLATDASDLDREDERDPETTSEREPATDPDDPGGL